MQVQLRVVNKGYNGSFQYSCRFGIPPPHSNETSAGPATSAGLGALAHEHWPIRGTRFVRVSTGLRRVDRCRSRGSPGHAPENLKVRAGTDGARCVSGVVVRWALRLKEPHKVEGKYELR